MPIKTARIINWYETRKCWRKKYKGKMYYLATGGKCNGEHDENGYLEALAEFHAIKSRVDAGLPAREDEGQPERKPLDIKIELPVKHVASFHDYSNDPPELPQASLALPENVNVAELIGVFVQEFKLRAESGDCTVSTYKEARDTLADFKAYCEHYRRTRMQEIDEHLLRCYRDRQRQLVQEGEYSPFTARKRLTYLRRFLEWAYKHRYLETIPRNVDRHFAKVVKLPDPDPQPFTKEQVADLWKAATTKTKFSRKGYRNALYVLLGLNCGYRSGDIAALKHSHVRRENGFWIIDRKREKTGSPQVHKLWPLTHQLLMDEATDPDQHENMLLDERGGLLVVNDIEQKSGVNDCIGRAFNRMKLKANIKGRGTGHSVLRDTGADTIKQQHPETPHIVSQYLGHKPKGMQTHYNSEHYDLLFTALDALDDYFALKM